MINRFRRLTNTEVKKRLLANFFSLSILQGANYFLPLLTIPYLVKVLGVEYFGLLAFSTAFVTYFQIITDYGFNITATKEISIHRDNRDKVVEIYSAVMTIKFILMLLSLVLMTIIVFSFSKFSKNWEIYYLTYGVVIGQMLFPVWLFQGMERMKYITILNILAKSIFTIAVFIFVRNANDYYIVPILTSLGFIVVGILSIIIISRKFNIKFKIQSISVIKHHLIDGWHIFIAGILTSFYTVSVTFILGLFSNNQVVGFYALADKIVRIVSNLITPINGAIFPFISSLVKTSKAQAIRFINKILIYSTITMILISTLIFVFAKNIIFLISSVEFEKSIVLLRILAFLPVILNIAIIISTNYLVNFELQSKLSKIYLFSALLSLFLSFLLVPLFYEIGSAITVLVVELFATTYMVLVIKKSILNAK